MLPLNGTKTHPLSACAKANLQEIADRAVPCSTVNPGVINRFLRDELVEIVLLPSPFKAHRGGTTEHLRITESGRAVLLCLSLAAVRKGKA